MGNGAGCGANRRVVPDGVAKQNNLSSLVSQSSSRQLPVWGRQSDSSGECLLFLRCARHISGCVQVRAWAERADGVAVGNAVQWPARNCNSSPSWFSAKALGFPLAEHEGVVVRVELIEQRSGKRGLLSERLSELMDVGQVEREVPRSFTTGPNLHKPATVSFQVCDREAVSRRKTVFLLRHGESVWNRAQAQRRLDEMAKTTDHPLSATGRQQAEDLCSRLASSSSAAKDVEDMRRPDVVFVSPLIRAVQTAVIALGPLMTQPGGQKEFLLMANAREKQNFGGLDTKSTKLGVEILRRTQDRLRQAYANQGSRTLDVFSDLRYDVQEVEDRWWCEGKSESKAQLNERLQEFMTQLLFSPHQTIVVVGHSHFFRAVCSGYLSDEFWEREPELAGQLAKRKLNNCGVARLELDPLRGLDGGPIVDFRVVLDSYLIEEKKWTPGLPGRSKSSPTVATLGSASPASSLVRSDESLVTSSSSLVIMESPGASGGEASRELN
mmetsp:Transcript_19118/g.49016  ORF Transcript_19118/g.49016 Transcript_19118/m.49016 type:complete len:497 (+) Transcript_19118:169-1659(+)